LTAAIAKVGTWFHATADTASLAVTFSNPKPSVSIVGTTLPTGKGFTAVTYVGAFDPAATTLWTEGWVRGY
jgi:hypothetical protein